MEDPPPLSLSLGLSFFVVRACACARVCLAPTKALRNSLILIARTDKGNCLIQKQGLHLIRLHVSIPAFPFVIYVVMLFIVI